MDRFDTWENKRNTVVNNFTRTKPPSPLFADYATVPRARHPEQAKNRGLYTQGIKNWIANNQDPNRKNPTPGTISIINRELGVFRIEYNSDTDGVIDQIVPSALDVSPTASARGITNLARFKLGRETPLAKDHTMETLVTVKWMFDPATGSMDNEKLYHDVELDYTNVLGNGILPKGPDIDVLSRKEYARFDRDWETSISP